MQIVSVQGWSHTIFKTISNNMQQSTLIKSWKYKIVEFFLKTMSILTNMALGE